MGRHFQPPNTKTERRAVPLAADMRKPTGGATLLAADILKPTRGSHGGQRNEKISQEGYHLTAYGARLCRHMRRNERSRKQQNNGNNFVSERNKLCTLRVMILK